MKKKIATLSLALMMFVSSVVPGFATSRLSRPDIEDVDVGKQSIKIDWNYIQHSDEYKVYRATSKSGTYKYIATTDESWYRDYSISKGKRYYYKVKAISYGDYNNSELSNWHSGKVAKPKAKVTTTASHTNSQTVYLTRTGSKYHRAGCRYLHSSSIPVSLSSAKSNGYTACSVCW